MAGMEGITEPVADRPDSETQPADPRAELMSRIIDSLKCVYDPEIPVDIWELGLIYRVDIASDNAVEVDMTLTTPNCPVAEDMPIKVKEMVEATEGVNGCTVNLVWEPPWNQDMMSEVAKVQLDMF
ncbi:MAG TPA: SUF system Fe-S cluster assembly protein [Azospirillaceae bacterium]|nr:SUF system Fe-S cluster assembly protein [Azospirillaceae bacterium]